MLIDIQYAKSLSPTGTPMGAYSTKWISGTIEKIIAEQKARIGRFFTYHKLLLDLRGRAEGIMAVDRTKGASLLSRINSGLINQKKLESEGIQMLSAVDLVKRSPIIQLMLTREIDYDVISEDVTLRADRLIVNLKNLLLQSARLNSDLGDHEGVVSRIERDIISIEGEIAGRGLIPKVTRILEKPAQMLKYVAIIAGVGALVYFLPKGKARGVKRHA